jgi:signal transduction histidine kinase
MRVIVLWNPLVTGVATLALGSAAGFWRGFSVSLLIATVCASVSVIPVAIALASEEHARRAGRTVAEHGHAWYIALAVSSMPLGLFLASRATEQLLGVRVPGSLADYRLALVLGSLISGLFFLWQTRADALAAALAAELRLEQVERHRLQAQLSALTAQLNPHLLFNALNTIAALVPSDPERAELTVLRLADLYRGILRATRTEWHTLADELAICEAFLDIERVRFRERLSAQVVVTPGLESVSVPVLVLQPLVENALTHGLADRARGGCVQIRAESSQGRLELSVSDDGVGLGRSRREGSGLGIEVTRRRLQLCYGESASLELSAIASGGTLARIVLPLERGVGSLG